MKKKLADAAPVVVNYVYKINIFRNGHRFWSSSFIRLFIYTVGAMLTAFLTATDHVADAHELTTFQWVKVACGSLAAGGIAIRAYVDQTVARNNDEVKAKSKTADSPGKSA